MDQVFNQRLPFCHVSCEVASICAVRSLVASLVYRVYIWHFTSLTVFYHVNQFLQLVNELVGPVVEHSAQYQEVFKFYWVWVVHLPLNKKTH